MVPELLRDRAIWLPKDTAMVSKAPLDLPSKSVFVPFLNRFIDDMGLFTNNVKTEMLTVNEN